MGKKLGAVSFVQILAPELNDRMLADFRDMESSVLVNLHVQSVDQVNAIKTVKRKINCTRARCSLSSDAGKSSQILPAASPPP